MTSKERRKNNLVPFEEEAIKAYLDRAIRSWREAKDLGTDQDKEMAVYYIDAFQSVRISLFGELLPKKEKEKNLDG